MNKNILLVDDAATVRMMQRKLLEENGFTVIGEAASGVEAIEKHRKLQPDLTILDITMPGMDGLVALKYMRSFQKDAKIVMCSSNWYLKSVVDALISGAAHFVTKPFQRDRFIYTVLSSIEIKQEFNQTLLGQLADECMCHEDIVMSQDQISELISYLTSEHSDIFNVSEILEKLGILYQEVKSDELAYDKVLKGQEKIIQLLNQILDKLGS
jgi:two-component system chemotaxis response regulator CheY